MSKELRRIILITLFFAIAIVVGYGITHYGDNGEIVTNIPVSVVDTERVTVTVEGEVRSPGEYSVCKGTNLHDCLFLAGGVTDDADLSGFDFDMVIFENCKVYVPKNPKPSATIDDDLNQPIDINKAGAEDFAKLHGIGDSLASQIINYRNLNGDFKSTEELMNVKGIGKSKYEAIKDMITVGGN